MAKPLYHYVRFHYADGNTFEYDYGVSSKGEAVAFAERTKRSTELAGKVKELIVRFQVIERTDDW